MKKYGEEWIEFINKNFKKEKKTRADDDIISILPFTAREAELIVSSAQHE